jgi:endonuclease G
MLGALALAGGAEGFARGAGRPAQPATPAAPPIASSVHLALGIPVAFVPTGDELIVKEEYAVGYRRSRSATTWVSWELNASWLGNVSRYRGRFLPDETLPAGWYRVVHEDYAGSGYDRGHLVPSQDRTRTPAANRATFVLTNVLPQVHELNEGPWLRLEELCHRLAEQGRELFLVAGGVYPAHPRTIGGGVSVPAAFFKIIVVLEPGQCAADVRASTRVIAVIMPNTSVLPDARWATYRTTVREVERQTGYDFLTRVPAVIQRVIETRVDDGPTR